MRIATWNVNWAAPRSAAYGRISARLQDAGADVLVVTEGQCGLLPTDGYPIDAGNDWGYGEKTHRRKVLAWSKRPWRDVRFVEDGAARGRVLAAITETDDGPVAVIAVCIPWQAAHVHTGRRDARPWTEHVECCAQLLRFRATLDAKVPTLIAGDYNQRIPRYRQSKVAEAALVEALNGMTVWTTGAGCEKLIDHVAGSPDLTYDNIDVWPAADAEGRLSDHTGVACDVHKADSANEPSTGPALTERE